MKWNAKNINYLLIAAIVIISLISFSPKKHDTYYFNADIKKEQNGVFVFGNDRYEIEQTIVKDKAIDGDGFSWSSDNSNNLVEITNSRNTDLGVYLGNKISDSKIIIPDNSSEYIFIDTQANHKKNLNFLSEDGVGEGSYSIYKLKKIK